MNKFIFGGKTDMETILNKKTIKELSSVLEEITDCPVSFCQDGQVIVSAASGAVGTQIPEALSAQNENRAVEAANGLYLPVRMDEKIPIGAVGIIGETESLLHMKSLSEKAISLVLKDNQIHGNSVRNPHSVMDYCMQALITGSGTGADYIKSFLASRHLKNQKKYRILVVCFNERLNPANLTMIDQEVYGTFDRTGSDLYTFRYPNEYVLMLEDVAYKKSLPLFRKLAERNRELLSIAVGQAVSPNRMPSSYKSARLALSSLKDRDTNFISYDDLNLELVLSAISDPIREQFTEKNLGLLSDHEAEILRAYYHHDMSLKETADFLVVHRNTLQYQLDRIHEKTGLDPRRFHDAVIFYLSLLL